MAQYDVMVGFFHAGTPEAVLKNLEAYMEAKNSGKWSEVFIFPYMGGVFCCLLDD